jgi:hypothetical protein
VKYIFGFGVKVKIPSNFSLHFLMPKSKQKAYSNKNGADENQHHHLKL